MTIFFFSRFSLWSIFKSTNSFFFFLFPYVSLPSFMCLLIFKILILQPISPDSIFSSSWRCWSPQFQNLLTLARDNFLMYLGTHQRSLLLWRHAVALFVEVLLTRLFPLIPPGTRDHPSSRIELPWRGQISCSSSGGFWADVF